MKKWMLLLSGLLALAVLTVGAAACGGDDDDGGETRTASPMASRTASPMASPTAMGEEPVKVGDLEITGPFARGAIDRGAVFFTVKNAGTEDDALIKASSPVADRVELHETVTEGASTMMQPVEKIDVPAGGEAVLEPGGLHVMLLDLTEELKKGTVVSVTLEFENAGTAEIEAEVMEYSDEPMPSGAMGEGNGGMGGN